MIQLPIGGQWTQTNTSDKFGSLAYSKNLNLDKKGFLSLSPRMVNIFDASGSVANSSSTAFNFPVAFGRYLSGTMRVATTEEPFNLTVTNTQKIIVEDVSTDNPNLAFTSHGKWWQNRFHESTDTTVSYNSAGTWTPNAITGLTAGKRHILEVFASRTQLCVSNGNVVKQYDTSYGNTTDLTIPSDYEVIGMAYNNSRLGVITRLGDDSAGQNTEARFYVWRGGSTAADSDASVGAYACVAVRAYKSSFVLINSAGQLLYWNGGGFDELAHFPFYVDQQTWGDLANFFSYGDNFVVDGDVIYINLSFELSRFGKKAEQMLYSNPSGVWCYDPQVGLYHRYSLSSSKAYLHMPAAADVNTTTDTITTSVTIPATGNPVMMVSGLGGVTKGDIYYIIKTSSTTFKLAATRDWAFAGVAVDITSAATFSYLWTYDVVDYGQSYADRSSAIELWGDSSMVYQDIIAGARIYNTSLSTVPTLCMAVPRLENRGYGVTPKIYLNSVSENIQKIYIKHSVLGDNDSIIIKVKKKDYMGIPVTAPNNASSSALTWTGTREAYTTSDLSEIKTIFDLGEEIEVEFTAGAGAGQLVKLMNIQVTSGTYTLEFAEDVVGVSGGMQSYFIMDNWKILGSVNAATQKDGIFECPSGDIGRNPQLKFELRGYNTTIEDFQIINATHQPSK